MIQSVKNDMTIFDWIVNERCSIFVWIKLKEEESLTNNIYTRDKIQQPKLSVYCPDSADRVNEIKNIYCIKHPSILNLIKNIKNEWINVANTKHPFKKIEKLETNSQDLLNWTWEYIKKKYEYDNNNNNNFYNRFLDPFTICPLMQVISQKDKLNAIFAIHDCYYARSFSLPLHKIFCIEYKRALSQKIFRNKKENKIINVQLNNQIKDKLDKLQYHYQYSQQRLLEMLISEHYKLIKDQIDN